MICTLSLKWFCFPIQPHNENCYPIPPCSLVIHLFLLDLILGLRIHYMAQFIFHIISCIHLHCFHCINSLIFLKFVLFVLFTFSPLLLQFTLPFFGRTSLEQSLAHNFQSQLFLLYVDFGWVCRVWRLWVMFSFFTVARAKLVSTPIWIWALSAIGFPIQYTLYCIVNLNLTASRAYKNDFAYYIWDTLNFNRKHHFSFVTTIFPSAAIF